MNVCAPCTYSVYGGQKNVSELGLKMIVSHLWVLGIELVLCKSSQSSCLLSYLSSLYSAGAGHILPCPTYSFKLTLRSCISGRSRSLWEGTPYPVPLASYRVVCLLPGRLCSWVTVPFLPAAARGFSIAMAQDSQNSG